jgi:hypothetical protein
MAIRQEINMLATGLAEDQYIQLDTSVYGDTVTYYLEVVAKVDSGTLTVSLRRKGTTTDDVSITVTETSYTRKRSISFTPPGGATEYFIFMSGGTVPVVRMARVIISQTGSISLTQTQVEVGSRLNGLTNTTPAEWSVGPLYWFYDSAVWSGTITAYAEINISGSGTMYTKTVTLQVDNGSFGGWTDVVTVVATTASALTRYRSASFTLTTGRNYRLVSSIANTMESYTIRCGKIVIDSTNSPLKFEPQFQLYMTPTVTGLQDSDTLYNPAEWSGGTFTYYHEGNGLVSGTNDLKLQDIAGPTDITDSTITDCVQRERTGALTMPEASATIDNNYTSLPQPNNGGSRIIVQVVLNPPTLIFFNNRTLRPRPFAP